MPRIKLELPDKFHFHTEIPVRITDLNYGNHLANDALLSILHETRIQFLGHLGYTEVNIEGYGIIMGDAAIIYKSQSYYGDILKIALSPSPIFLKKTVIFSTVCQKEKIKSLLTPKPALFFLITRPRNLCTFLRLF